MALIGNSGVGKSTILNGLVGKAVFHSGLSFGSGLTTHMQRYVVQGGNVYVDTPGLSDIQMRKQAAEEIAKALREGGPFKIVFVMTLEGGRVRPDDNATRKLVLEAAPEIGTNYSIILNKVTRGEARGLSRPENMENLKISLMASCGGAVKWTSSIIVCGVSAELAEGEDDALVPLSPALASFLDNAPVCQITPAKVADINHDAFEKLKEEAEKLRKQYETDKAAWTKKLNELDEQHKKDMKDNADKLAALTTELRTALDEAKEARKKAEDAEKARREAESRGGGGLWKAIVGAVATVATGGLAAPLLIHGLSEL